jgi:hypothetical protein
MTQMRDLLDLINEMSEDEGSVELQDSFDIEIGDDLLIESGVIDINEDGILIQGDDESISLLAEHGVILEETDWSKYDEPTVSRIKRGVTKPVDKTDYDKPTYQRKKEKEVKKEEELDEAEYRGRKVPLGKPMQGDVKKKKVYVKKPNGNVVKVEFGDKKMRIKKSNPKRRKSFRARHNCANPGPRWKARYWSCRAW